MRLIRILKTSEYSESRIPDWFGRRMGAVEPTITVSRQQNLKFGPPVDPRREIRPSAEKTIYITY
jgi:hypothetical protein